MRHWIKIIIWTLILSFSGILVRGTTLSTLISGSATVEVGKEVTLTFAIEVDVPVKQITATLDFDKDLLEIVGSPTVLNGLDVLISDNREIMVSSADGVSGSISFMRITFKAKEAFTVDGTVSVSLNDVLAILVDSDESVSGNGNTKIITSIAPKSSNNFLSDLSTNVEAIEFTPSVLEYSLTVDHAISRIRILAKTEDSKAVVIEDSTFNLDVYQNSLKIVVTAENGAKRTYTINVIRKDALGNIRFMSSNSELKSLAVDGYEIDFSPLISEYRLTVGNIVDNVLVVAEATDPKSSVIIDNVPLLLLGENRIQITVVAENSQSRIYTIFVTRSLDAPVTQLRDLEGIIYLTTASVLPVIMDDTRWLSESVLDKVRRAAKVLDIQKLDEQGTVLYRWLIDGRSITTGNIIDLNIDFQSRHSEKFTELLNSSKFKTINFSHIGELPVGTTVRVYIGSLFSHMSSLNLYRYDTDLQLLKLNSQSLRVDNGYVEFEVLLAGEYVVSDVELKQEHPTDVVLLIALTIIVMIIAALVWLLFSTKRMSTQTMS